MPLEWKVLYAEADVSPGERPHSEEPEQHVCEGPGEGGEGRRRPRGEQRVVEHSVEGARPAAGTGDLDRDQETRNQSGEEEHCERVEPEHGERRRPPARAANLDRPVARGEGSQGRARSEDRVRAGPQGLVDGEPAAPREAEGDAGEPRRSEAPRGDGGRAPRPDPVAGEDPEERRGRGRRRAEDALGSYTRAAFQIWGPSTRRSSQAARFPSLPRSPAPKPGTGTKVSAAQ
jgi:hypothetical protein